MDRAAHTQHHQHSLDDAAEHVARDEDDAEGHVRVFQHDEPRGAEREGAVRRDDEGEGDRPHLEADMH